MDVQQGGQPGLAGAAANALQVEQPPPPPPQPPPPQPQQAVVGAGPYVPVGAGSPPLPPNAGAEAAQAVPGGGHHPAGNLHFRPVVAAAGGVVSMSGQSALGRVPSPPPTDGATPIAENW